MTRQNVKNAIKTIVANATGVTSVFTYRPKSIDQTEMPYIVVNLPKSRETRQTATAPIGKKHIDFTAQLEIFTIDTSNDGSGQNDFDDLLDAVDVELRKDPTLGGAVLASTIEFINTNQAPPTMVNGENVALMAVKQFDVTVQVTG